MQLLEAIVVYRLTNIKLFHIQFIMMHAHHIIYIFFVVCVMMNTHFSNRKFLEKNLN
jgi:hypothetical protein